MLFLGLLLFLTFLLPFLLTLLVLFVLAGLLVVGRWPPRALTILRILRSVLRFARIQFQLPLLHFLPSVVPMPVPPGLAIVFLYGKPPMAPLLTLLRAQGLLWLISPLRLVVLLLLPPSVLCTAPP
jgi:hypothetical protein